MTLLNPWQAKSRYREKSAWDSWQISDVTGLDAFIAMVEQLSLPPLETAIALEQIRSARWIVNRVEVRNPSPHAVVERAKVSIDHSGRGLIQPLGGTVEFEQRGQRLTAQVDRLLPKESRWTIIRTNNGRITGAELQKIVDTQPEEVEARLKSEMETVMQKNIVVHNENRALEEQMAEMEQELVDTKMKWATVSETKHLFPRCS